LVSHPFRRKKRNGWGTEDYSKNKNALKLQAATPENIPHEHIDPTGCQISCAKRQAHPHAALAHAHGSTGAFFGCGDRFIGHPAAAARQHGPAVAVAGGAWRESLVADNLCGCRQHSGRVLDLAGRPQRRRGSTAALCAQTHSQASYRVGRASQHPCHLCSRHASAADSAVTVCAGLRRAGRFARALHGGLRRGSQSAILSGCVAGGGVWTPRSEDLVRHSAKMVDAAALRVCGLDGGRRLLWGLEDSAYEQDGCGEEVRFSCRCWRSRRSIVCPEPLTPRGVIG